MAASRLSIGIVGVLGTVIAVAAGPAAAQLGTRNEPFNAGPGGFTAAAGTDADGNSFGFSNTDNTAGASPAGEAGGTFARTGAGAISYLADPAVGVLTRNDALSVTGELAIVSNNNFDGVVFVGYFNTASPGGPLLGLELMEPGGGTGASFRGRLTVITDGGATQQSGNALVDPGAPTTFSFNWAPSGAGDGSGTLAGTVAGQQVEVTVGPEATSTFDAFGIGAGFVNSSNSAQQAVVYFDNLSYSAIPEPAALGLLPAALVLLRRAPNWRKKCSGLTASRSW